MPGKAGFSGSSAQTMRMTAQLLPPFAEIGRIALKVFIPGKDHLPE
ncbi:MAG: hypothetical protein MUO63_17035 [Desulfobulbaceae bacterium]|nr:hypothetical protein [Desulfobulbaceae bacterium]